MMAYNQCFGESFPQFAEQSEQGTSLRQCTCVLGTSGNIQPSFVTNTYRMGVMVTAVCPDLFQRTALANFSIAGDVEMVTDVTESTVLDMKMCIRDRCMAMPVCKICRRSVAIHYHSCRSRNNVRKRKLVEYCFYGISLLTGPLFFLQMCDGNK